MRLLILIGALCFPGVSSAENWAFRNSDTKLSVDDMAALANGSALTFYDDGTSKFSAGGSYSYTYASGESAFGRFEVRDSGVICIFFRNGFDRCDAYVRNAGRLVVLTQNGQRYPVRDALSAED